MNTCPVCGYNKLEEPPRRYFICPSCGTEFDLDDRVKTHEQLRSEWLREGAPWFDYETPMPQNWSPYMQLLAAGMGYTLAAKNSSINKQVEQPKYERRRPKVNPPEVLRPKAA